MVNEIFNMDEEIKDLISELATVEKDPNTLIMYIKEIITQLTSVGSII